MLVTAVNYKYHWRDSWARVVDNESGRTNGRTHGVQVTSNDEVVVFAQANPAVLIFDASGTLLRSWGDRFSGAHGLTLVSEGGTDYLWLTDERSAEVAKMTMSGATVQNLEPPSHPEYDSGGKYVPTWAAVNEERFGGNGDVWVADGYGSSLVHRFSKSGEQIGTLDGTTGAGRFGCPHGIFFDHRGPEPLLLIADRSNRRIQVFDSDGGFVQSFGEEFLVHPDCFSTHEDLLLVPELFGRVALLDGSNKLIGYLGENDLAKETPGWPNLSADQLRVGKFNSPHGGTFDAAGNIYIVEWIIGGRITKLEKVN